MPNMLCIANKSSSCCLLNQEASLVWMALGAVLYLSHNALEYNKRQQNKNVGSWKTCQNCYLASVPIFQLLLQQAQSIIVQGITIQDQHKRICNVIETKFLQDSQRPTTYLREAPKEKCSSSSDNIQTSNKCIYDIMI